MVHLSRVPTFAEIDKPLIEGFKDVKLREATDDDFSTSVYGSRFAAEELPKHEMPEGEMPKEVAYRMIKDDLSMDGNPMMKSVPP